MAYRTFQAVVLARSDWRENDRILTLVGPETGRADALCRGCRKPNSPLMGAAELFTLGEYVLFSGKGKELVHTCAVIESFYPLRLEYDRLAYAALVAGAALKVSQPEEPNPHLFILLVRSLKRLAYSSMPPGASVCAFLLHLSAITGFKPRLNHCVRCGREILQEGGYLLAEEGGICCASCGKGVIKNLWISSRELDFLRSVLARGIDKAGEPPDRVPLLVMKEYFQSKIESKLPDLPEEQNGIRVFEKETGTVPVRRSSAGPGSAPPAENP